MFTRHGHILFEAVSALQKAIRRGEEYEAMAWAVELAPTHESYLWRRLTTIANEDIGLADPTAVAFVNAQRDAWWDMRAAGDDAACYLILANTILAMSRAPKSRLADHFQCVVVADVETGGKRTVPDYALDKHTLRGKQMGRGMSHWLTEGTKLSQPAEVHDPYAAQARDLWLSNACARLPALKPAKTKSQQARLFDE